MTTGASASGPADTVFELVQDGSGAGVFERSSNGSGAVITNHWSDDKADHYFGWVQSQGWEYVFPKDASQPSRVVYVGLTTAHEGDVTRPSSPASATCALVPAT